MARTKRNAMNIAETRQRVQTTQLLKRLTGHALGEIDMLPSQVRACEVLLKKTLPDLAQHQLTGGDGGPLAVNIIRYADHQPAE